MQVNLLITGVPAAVWLTRTAPEWSKVQMPEVVLTSLSLNAPCTGP